MFPPTDVLEDLARIYRGARIPTDATKQLGRMLAIFGTLGVVAGLAAAGFVALVDGAGQLLVLGTDVDPAALASERDEIFVVPEGRHWLVLTIPALGGLVSGWLCARIAPEAMGTGSAGVIDAYHQRGAGIRGRAPVVKAVASAVTIGTGGSAGVEGPIGYVVAGTGAALARVFRVSAAERRLLVMAGFAAGIGAVFHAPMAASIFAAEVLYRDLDLEYEVLVPAIISSTIAYAVFGAVRGWDPVWELPKVGFGGIVELGPYLALAFACALAGALFIALHQRVVRRIGRAQRVPLWLRPAIGGLGVGAIGLVVPSALGIGHGLAQTAIDGRIGIVALLVAIAAKMVTSSLTAGSGGSGGLFAPSLVIGALLGAFVAEVTNLALPWLSVDPAAFAVVGMAGFFAAVVNAPLSTVIMVSELAGSYRLLVPTLWVCALSWFLLRRRTLFSEQVHSRFEAPGHVADMMGAVLRRLTVHDAMSSARGQLATVAPNLSLRELVRVFSRTAQAVFPIVDAGGTLLGVVDGRELRRTIDEEGIDTILIADDFRVPAAVTTPDESLEAVVRRMEVTGHDELIVTAADSKELLGVVSRREIIAAYHRRMLQRDRATGAHAAVPVETEAQSPDPPLMQAIERGGIVYGLDDGDSTSVLTAIVERAALPDECPRARLLDLLLERERLGSTYVGDGFALPHPQTDELPGLDEPRVIIAPLGRPVPWNGADARATTVIMLLAHSGPQHLELLASLAKVLHDTDVRELLRKRASPKRLHETLRRVIARDQGAPSEPPT